MRIVAAAALALVVGASPTGATTLLKMGFGDLVREADQIVVGTVASVQGEWDDSFRFIHTNVTLAVERSLRGMAPSEIVLRTPGGEVGGEAQRAVGAATFEPGEKVLVFLTREEDGALAVLGWLQGKSRIVEDEDGTLRLRGGVADGRSLDGVELELRHGPNYNIPLGPAR
jgi:hypothetical protein